MCWIMLNFQKKSREPIRKRVIPNRTYICILCSPGANNFGTIATSYTLTPRHDLVNRYNNTSEIHKTVGLIRQIYACILSNTVSSSGLTMTVFYLTVDIYIEITLLLAIYLKNVIDFFSLLRIHINTYFP